MSNLHKQSVTMPTGATAVVIKDEDMIGAQIVGPVYFHVRDEAADTVEFVPALEREERDFLGNPQAQWMTAAESKKMADHFGLEWEVI